MISSQLRSILKIVAIASYIVVNESLYSSGMQGQYTL